MTLNLSIANALSGIKMAQRSLDAVSQNISNAQTPGYTRKVLPQESAIVGGLGAGVRSGELERVVDAELQAELRRTQGTQAGYEISESYLQRIEQLQGRPEDETSLASTFSRLETSFEKLSAAPENRAAQIQVVSDAGSLTAQLNSVSNEILGLRNQTQNDIKNTVDEMNAQLRRIGELNQQIVQGVQDGRSTASLEDLRDQALSDLSKQIDISTIKTTDNRLIVLTRSGETLVDRTVQQFDFEPSRLDDSSYYRASPPGTIPGVTLRGNGRDVTGQLNGGRIGALLDLRDATLPKLQGQLDEFAQKMAMRFDEQGMPLFTDRDGSIPRDIQGAYVGFASRIQVNTLAQADPSFVRYGAAGASVSPDPAISNQRIMDVLNYAFGTKAGYSGPEHAPFRTTNLGSDPFAKINSGLPAQASLGDFLKQLVVAQSQMRADTTSKKEQTETLASSLETKISDMSGVNLDTEIGQLTILQRSYASSAQVLRTSEQLLDELFSVVR